MSNREAETAKLPCIVTVTNRGRRSNGRAFSVGPLRTTAEVQAILDHVAVYNAEVDPGEDLSWTISESIESVEAFKSVL
jgi:hypothetical protein